MLFFCQYIKEGPPLMDIREIRYILEIARTRNMTKAAANLFITQPALSKMLKKVELELGMPLFFREGNIMLPSEAGSLLVEHGTKLTSTFDEMDNQLRELKAMKRGKVVLGIPPVIAAFDFPEIIMRFRRHYPDVAVEIQEYGARKLECMVLDGLLDIAVSMHPVLSDGLSEMIIVQDQVVCAMNPEHPLAQCESISYDGLSRYPLNTFPVNFAVYQELIRNFQSRALSPIVDVTSPTCDFLLKMSHLSNEVCVLPAPCVRYYDKNELVIRPFDPVFQWGLCVVYRKNMYMSEKVRALIACIQQTVEPPV